MQSAKLEKSQMVLLGEFSHSQAVLRPLGF